MYAQYVKDVLAAIDSVKSRAIKAKEEEKTQEYLTLMGDLTALEVSLVIEVKKMMDDIENQREAA